MTSVESEVASLHLYFERKNKVKSTLEALFSLLLVARWAQAHTEVLHGRGP